MKESSDKGKIIIESILGKKSETSVVYQIYISKFRFRVKALFLDEEFKGCGKED